MIRLLLCTLFAHRFPPPDAAPVFRAFTEAVERRLPQGGGPKVRVAAEAGR